MVLPTELVNIPKPISLLCYRWAEYTVTTVLMKQNGGLEWRCCHCLETALNRETFLSVKKL